MPGSLQRPPSDCPNDGLCFTLQPRVENVEDGLGVVNKDLSALRQDVHEIKITLRERDNLMGFLKTVFVALLGIFVMGLIGTFGQVVMTARWMAQTDMKFEVMTTAAQELKSLVADHEVRLRDVERKP